MRRFSSLVLISSIISWSDFIFESVRKEIGRDFAYAKEKLVNQAVYDQMKKKYQVVIDIEASETLPEELIKHLQEEFNSLKKWK